MWAESWGAEEAGNNGMLGEGGENVAGALGVCYLLQIANLLRHDASVFLVAGCVSRS